MAQSYTKPLSRQSKTPALCATSKAGRGKLNVKLIYLEKIGNVFSPIIKAIKAINIR